MKVSFELPLSEYSAFPDKEVISHNGKIQNRICLSNIEVAIPACTKANVG